MSPSVVLVLVRGTTLSDTELYRWQHAVYVLNIDLSRLPYRSTGLICSDMFNSCRHDPQPCTITIETPKEPKLPFHLLSYTDRFTESTEKLFCCGFPREAVGQK
jgi:hypothetical protein